jgi:hypothetical protein
METRSTINVCLANKSRYLRKSNCTSATFLGDITKFRDTRRVSKPTIELIYSNLRNYLTDKYIYVIRKTKGQIQRTLKTYTFLVFKENTDLLWARKLVHQIVPLVEIDTNCFRIDCTCKGSINHSNTKATKRRPKRRGFGYITETNLNKTILKLEQHHITCVIKTLAKPKPRLQPQQNLKLKLIKCSLCKFFSKSDVGFLSHMKRHSLQIQNKSTK